MRKRVSPDVVIEPIMRSASMREADRILRAVSPKDVVVCLIGESGVGKEILARRVHDLSSRRSGPFVPINCAAIPEALFESELFGHEKGAFTGATDRARGKLEVAAGGTLFLDEVGEMPLGMQAKLLRFLENKKFMRVGGTTKISVDARLVCATLRPLDEEVRAGRFRADLFYRLQGISIRVPALRDRLADLVPLIQQFTAQLSAKHDTKPPRWTRAVMNVMRTYEWPGNIRELKNVVERAVLLADREIDAEHLPTEKMGATWLDATPAPLPEPRPVPKAQVQAERERIEKALVDCAGNQTQAARLLGISRRTLVHRLDEYGLPRPKKKPRA